MEITFPTSLQAHNCPRLENMIRRQISLPLVVVLALVAPAWASVTVYPAPSGATLSKQYAVSVDGKPVDVYQAPIWNPSYAPAAVPGNRLRSPENDSRPLSRLVEFRLRLSSRGG